MNNTEQSDIALSLGNLTSVLEKVTIETRSLNMDDGIVGYAVSIDDASVVGGFTYIFPEQGQFAFYLLFLETLTVEKIVQVASLITHINNNLIIGNFEIDHDSLALRFKVSVDFFGTNLSEIIIRNAIIDAIEAVETFGSTIIDVANGEKTLLDAMAEI